MLPADLGEVVDVGASGEGVPQLIQLAVKRCVPKALLQHGGPREANNRLRYIIMHFAVRGAGEKARVGALQRATHECLHCSCATLRIGVAVDIFVVF